MVAGYLYATWLEWILHKYILHGLGKKKNSWFNFHWHSHHRSCRKNSNLDENYNLAFNQMMISLKTFKKIQKQLKTFKNQMEKFQ